MPLHVLAQVVRAHESVEANVADELFLARVRPEVPGQLVGP